MTQKKTGFELFANDYDGWFAENQPLLESEVRLLAHIWPEPAPTRVLSIGCGTGLFEAVLKRDFGIKVSHGIEPAEAMAEIARSRGMEVILGTAEEADFGIEAFDMLIFNGSTSYVKDLVGVYKKARKALRPGGHLLTIDVPRESGFGVLYCLAAELGTWDHPLMVGVAPRSPYPMPFVQSATWHTTSEQIEAMEGAGFSLQRTAQTLTTHPSNAGAAVEMPRDGHDSGDYVAILAQRLRESRP